MKLLLDTHIILWAAGQPEKLSESARALLTTPGNTLFFSAASIWEIVIKRGLGREDFKVDPDRLEKMLVTHGYTELPVTAEHALKVETLPLLHKDPFDRLLLAQARAEGMLLLTVESISTLIKLIFIGQIYFVKNNSKSFLYRSNLWLEGIWLLYLARTYR